MDDNNPENSGQISGMEEVAIQAAEESHPATTSGLEALDIGLQLDQLLKGMGSVLSRMDQQDEDGLALRDELSKIRERIVEMEEAQKKWDNERDQILQHSVEVSEGVDPEVRAQAQANAAKAVQSTAAALKTNASLDRIKFAQSIKDMPQEEIISPGKIVFTRGPSGFPTPTLFNEVIRINGMEWQLPAGQPLKVPKIVADRYRQMILEKEELAARRHVLSATNVGKHRHEKVLVEDWNAVSSKYGSPTEPMPVAGDDM
ncbi:MAG: hypothetical protein V3S81_09590 [Anaerolineales bacterium]